MNQVEQKIPTTVEDLLTLLDQSLKTGNPDPQMIWGQIASIRPTLETDEQTRLTANIKARLAKEPQKPDNE